MANFFILPFSWWCRAHSTPASTGIYSKIYFFFNYTYTNSSFCSICTLECTFNYQKGFFCQENCLCEEEKREEEKEKGEKEEKKGGKQEEKEEEEEEEKEEEEEEKKKQEEWN